MARRAVNIWPAYADMLFMLFICALLAAAYFAALAKGDCPIRLAECEKARDGCQHDLRETTEDLVDCKGDLAECRKKNIACGGTGALLESFARCMQRKGVQGVQFQEGSCLATINEDLIKFTSNTVQPEGQRGKDNANALAECLFTAEMEFYSQHRDLFDSRLQYIYLDGHTDPVGEDFDNLKFSASRGLHIYGLITEKIYNSDIEAGVKDALAKKVAVRAFGSHQPSGDGDGHCGGRVQDDQCDYAADRRVVISVQDKLSRAGE